VIPFFATALSRFLRPHIVRLATKDLEEEFRAQERQKKIDRLAGDAAVDAAVEAALDAAEAACEKFCHDHPDELQIIIDGKGSAEFKESWKLRYRAVESAAYNRALAEARSAPEGEDPRNRPRENR
jgi:uncharacterized cupin superfamily protein